MKYLEVKDKIKIGLLLAFLIISLIFFNNLKGLYLFVEKFIIGLGPVKGAILYSIITILAVTITPIPYSPFAVISGSTFGPFFGILISLFSTTIGAVIAFLIGRLFLYNFFWKRFRKNKIYRKMLEEDHNHILKFIVFSRLMPQAPFDAISYFSGITTIKVWKFALANIIGMLPLIIILSLFGSSLENYRVIIISVIIAFSVFYAIFRIIKYKVYYVRGY